MKEVKEFLSQVTVVDTETTSADPKEAELVEVASGYYGDDSWAVESQLVRPIRDIPYEASAIHHISNRMVRNFPTFDEQIDRVSELIRLNSTQYMAAHNAHFDRVVLGSAYSKGFVDEIFEPFVAKEKWICTWRLAREVLAGSGFEKKKDTLSYLRYSLDLDVPEELPAHRAGADVFTCGRLLEKLIEIAIDNGQVRLEKDIGEQLIHLCYKPYKHQIWPFGKHKGKKLTEVPTDYYVWAIDNMDILDDKNSKYDEDLAHSVTEVLESRLN